MFARVKISPLSQSFSSLNALESGPFRTYLSGQGISAAGSGMQQVALAWLVYRTTHSAWALGALTIAALLGQFITSFAGGYLADKCDRKTLLIRLQWIGALISITLSIAVFFKLVTIPVILLSSLILGGFLGMEYPVRQSLNMHLVKPDHVLSARGLYASVVSSSVALGQATAGIMIDALPAFGEMACLILNAISYVLSLALLWKMVPISQTNDSIASSVTQSVCEGDRSAPSADPGAAKLAPSIDCGFTAISKISMVTRTFAKQIQIVLKANLDCLQYVFRSDIILFSFIQTIVLVLFGMRYVPLLPAFAAEVFSGGAQASGILTGAVALGYAAGALVCGSLRNKQRLELWADLSLTLLPIALLLFCQTENLQLGLFFVLLMAICQSANVNSCICLLQLSAPHELFGRLMGLRVMVVAVADLLGAVAVTSVVQKFGLTKTTMVAALICFILAIVILARRARGAKFLNALASGAALRPAPIPVDES